MVSVKGQQGLHRHVRSVVLKDGVVCPWKKGSTTRCRPFDMLVAMMLLPVALHKFEEDVCLHRSSVVSISALLEGNADVEPFLLVKNAWNSEHQRTCGPVRSSQIE